MVHVGIDIGTSNTVVAIAAEGGEPTVRKIKDEVLVPSLIAVSERGGNLLVGNDAVDEWANPDRDAIGIFRRWKLHMGEGKSFQSMRFGGELSTPLAITPEWLTTRLVEYVLAEVASGVGGDPIESVLITVPHGWRRDTPEKCQATRDAAGAAIVAGSSVTVQQITVSEPVAAAAYWLWGARSALGGAENLAGARILVCDVGGGTVDLSLVRVGADSEPLTVIDAINNNYAGDYATALLMALAAEQYNDEFGASLPTDADEILRQLEEAPSAQMRSWFIELQRLQREMSTRFSAALKRGQQPTRKISALLEHSEGDMKLSITPEEFVDALRPFYDKGRQLVESFLGERGGIAPYVVVFAGGGSRIHGVEQYMVAPALRSIYGTAAEDALNRLEINSNKIDQAIALGAALVASETVRVEERLLCDIGLEAIVDESLSIQLNLPVGEPVLVTPILERGSRLPAHFSSEVCGLDAVVEGGQSLEFTIVIDDSAEGPWNQSHRVDVPAASGTHQCGIQVSADSDGVLNIELIYRDGTRSSIQGRLFRERTGRSKLLFRGAGQAPLPADHRSRVTPAQLRSAMAAIESRGGRG